VNSFSFDALVVGAGIVGAACARGLAEAGLRVAVCEQSGVVGGGATAAGMGHLAVMDDSDAQFALTSYSQKLWRDLAGQLPADAEYLPCGSLWIAADEEEFREVERKHSFYSERGMPVEILDAAQLQQAEPNLRPDLIGGLLLPADSVCYPPCATSFFLQSPRIDVFLGKRVLHVSESGIRMQDGTEMAAGLTVLATGAAIAELIPEVEVKPRKGHLLITDRYPGFVRHQLIELGYLKSAHSTTSDSVAFNAQPRMTGQILLGSSRQYGTDEPQIDARILNRMLRRGIEYMPALERMSAIRTWTGFRAATPDKLPLIGRCPGFENVYLATGHEGLGISTSMATARLLGDLIFNRASDISREPYAPDRRYAHHEC
jgi:glycine/D-amino acid oxidase-like deaminating enzyme